MTGSEGHSYCTQTSANISIVSLKYDPYNEFSILTVPRSLRRLEATDGKNVKKALAAVRAINT